MEKPLSLVLAAGSLGDSLLTLPALRQLQSQWNVTLAGTFPYQALGADLLGIDKVLPLDPLLQPLLTPGSLSSPLEETLSRYSQIYIFFKEKKDLLLEHLSSLGKPQVHFPSQSFEDFLTEGRWAAHYWLDLVQEDHPTSSPFRQELLYINEALKEKGREWLKIFGLISPLVLHPGSGSKSKNSPLSFFRTAAERAIHESNRDVLVLWGEAEEKDLPSIQKAFEGLKKVHIPSQILPLRDLAGVFSQSRAYLGNDSGVTQLASACGLRTFAVFNSTDARVWGPQVNAIILSMLKGNLT
jgi:ADP-heptose:LPS heptosyltransferase